jgi:arylsulfatase A-like enzyme
MKNSLLSLSRIVFKPNLAWSMAGLAAIIGLLEGLIGWVRMISGLAEAMGPEILWVAPLFYSLVGLGLGIVSMVGIYVLGKIQVIPMKILSILPLLAMGFICWIGFFNLITMFFSSATWALLILAAGLAVQTIQLLSRHKFGTVTATSRMIPIIGIVVLCLWIVVSAQKFAREYWMHARLPPAQQDSPNVLVIVLDTLRADHLSSYGYQRSTPNLDQFASEGALFEQAFATASWTLPSHASLFTGLMTHEHHADVLLGQKLDDSFYTLPEAFSDNGYTTGLIAANDYRVNGVFGFHQGFSYYNDLFWDWESSVKMTRLGERLSRIISRYEIFGYYQFGRKTAQDVNEIFLDWLGRSQGRPTFAFLNYYDPHDPYYAPPPYDNKYGVTPALGQPGSFINGASEYGGTVSPEEIHWQIDHYDATVYYLDAKLGELFARMKELGVYDNTIILITSDHGESFGEHELYGHANSLYIEQLHVPLMIRYQPAISKGERVSQVVSLKDVPRTLADLAGLHTAQQFPGSRLDQVETTETALAELYHNPYHPESHPVHYGSLTSFTSDEWHAIFLKASDTGKYQEEIYARSDVLQSTNLAGTAAADEALSQYRSILLSIPPLSYAH